MFGEDSFISVLKKLADRVEEKEIAKLGRHFLNRIDLTGFKKVQDEYRKNRSLCKKVLNIVGFLRLALEYGPIFKTRLQTERAGPITVHVDDFTLYGCEGTALHPISLILAGFGGCFSAAFAKWAAMSNIKLNKLDIRAKADLNFTSSLGIEDNIPIIDNYEIELTIDTEASQEELEQVSLLTKLRCFCYYCATNSIIPRIFIKKGYIEEPPLTSSDFFSVDLVRSRPKRGEMINRINIERFKETQEIFSQNRELCKRSIEVSGKWRVDVEYGPQFEILLDTENAGQVLIQTDETLILGGGGTSFHPVALCIAGFSGCISIDFARWCAMNGIIIKKFKIDSRMSIDLTTGFGIAPNIPMIDDFVVDLYIDSDASMSELLEVLEIIKKRCICYNCYITPILPNVIITKVKPKLDKEVIKEEPIKLLKEIETPLEKLHFFEPHNIKIKTSRIIEMKEL